MRTCPNCNEQACETAIGAAEVYDHTKVADWNTTIIVSHPPFVNHTHTRHSSSLISSAHTSPSNLGAY